jgi:thiamine biosynthesis lipoprotein
MWAAAAEAGDLEKYEAAGTHMGTLIRVIVWGEKPPPLREAFDRARSLDEALSDYRFDSELNRLCRAGAGAVSEDLWAVLEVAQRVSRQTDGAFDVTIGPAVHLWRESRRLGELPSAAEVRKARSLTGWRNLRLDAKSRQVRLARAGMQLDLGGIAKGYAADEMLRLLESRGFPRALIAAGGDIAAGDPPPGRAGWTVATITGKVEIARGAVSTSGDAEQFIEIGGRRYAHILDPKTGLGLTSRIAVSVQAGSGVLADAYATALAAMGEKSARRFAASHPELTVRISRAR